MNTDQIAEEETRQCAIALFNDETDSRAGTILTYIKSAIEKARLAFLEWQDKERMETLSRAAHASEQGADVKALATRLDWVLQHATTFNDLQTRENLGAIRDELFALSQRPTPAGGAAARNANAAHSRSPKCLRKALDGWPVEGSSSELLIANPECVCATTAEAMFCPYGHMLGCHYPQTCEEAECDHYKRQMEAEQDL